MHLHFAVTSREFVHRHFTASICRPHAMWSGSTLPTMTGRLATAAASFHMKRHVTGVILHSLTVPLH